MVKKNERQTNLLKTLNRYLILTVFLSVTLIFYSNAQAFTLSVVDKNDSPITEYRWVVEEDTTYHVNPGVPDPNTLAVRFHSSYMPVVAKGDESTTLPTLDPNKRYFVSVIPKLLDTFTIGGAPLEGDGTVKVYVNHQPIPVAQITIVVYEDLSPINNARDQGEPGLGGFAIVIEDAGGRYGISAGMQMQDVFGNPLGTTYDEFGNPNGFNPLVTAPDGTLTIKNLAPGKYGVIAVPPNAVEDPLGSGNYVSSNWTQTSTIEGKKVIDAWVKANEPPFFAEFGIPGPHVSIGFVPAGRNNPYINSDVLNGGSTITGQVVNLHLSRPPNTAFHNGAPFAHTTPWVGLNEGAAGGFKGVYAARASGDGSFSIPNIPPGNYQVVFWDDNLDLIFAFYGVTVPEGGGEVDIGEVPVFQWFTRIENWVFNDDNENGFRDDGEAGMNEQAVNIRWRDGTIYQSFPTDGAGFVPFDEVFPFFSWMVAEVDFARFKATGLTVTVDDGGAIPFFNSWSWGGQLNPQAQGEPADPVSLVTTNNFRTELGPVLTQGFLGFLGQTSVFEWGKKAYALGENGGISGIVYYATTRAENDPELAGAEVWEPGIPRVTVNLYDSTGTVLLNTTTTDSWDDSIPTDCQYGANAGSSTDDPFVFRGIDTDCYDGMRNWNQVRPGVFDGGYAFDSIIDPDTQVEISPIPPGQYVVEVIPPTGYDVIKSQDKNVDFGDTYTPAPELELPECVGAPYIVPAKLSLFPDVDAKLAGQELKTCDHKLVALSNGANAAADFFLFTETPISGHIIGFILDDAANEFDSTSPQFGEKYAPPWLPVSIRDWTGREIARTHSDEFGRYNALVPSTFTENLPQPSGISPNMITTCMNDPGSDPNNRDPFFNAQYSTFCYTFQYMPGTTTYLDTPVIPVAAFAGPDQNPLDCEFPNKTPRILSVTNAANQGPYVTAPGETITIQSMGSAVPVPNPAYDGVGGLLSKTINRDYSFGTPGTVKIGGISLTNVSWGPDTITGTVADGTQTGQLVVTRDDNGKSSITGVTVQVGLRTGSSIVQVPEGGSIQTAIDNAGANDLILVEPGNYNEMVIMWKPVQLQGWGEGSTIINAVKTPAEKLTAWRAKVESLVTSGQVDLVPGQNQGFGGIEVPTLFSEEGAGVLVLAKATGDNRFDRDRNQDARIDGFTIRGADTGGGVVANGFNDYLDISNNRIINNSGFFGGGVRIGHPKLTFQQGNDDFYSDADNDNVKINHNHITQNGASDGPGGGVSICTGSDAYEVSENFICGNFTMDDGGGIAHIGLSMDGLIANNTVLFNENFNQGVTVNGGGISISGQPSLLLLNGNDCDGDFDGDGDVDGSDLSVFSADFGRTDCGVPTTCPGDFDNDGDVDGSDLSVFAGNFGRTDCLLPPGQAAPTGSGSGSLQIIGNLVQGNSAGAGDGGGIRTNRINGQDVVNNPDNPGSWYTIDIINNMIVNNVAALAGGGISLQDTLRGRIYHNTIANNDNASTAAEAFLPGSPSESSPQPGAGVTSRIHSAGLAAVLPTGEDSFSNPDLKDNIIWQNRRFFFVVDDTDPSNVLSGLCPDINGDIGLNCPGGNAVVYDDLVVLPASAGSLNPISSIITGGLDPKFVAEYVNGNRESTITNPEATTAIQAVPAFDEGGNFIRLRYGPLSQTKLVGPDWVLVGDYHIQTASPAEGAGIDVGVTDDFDDQTRPNGTGFDIGADEYYAPPL